MLSAAVADDLVVVAATATSARPEIVPGYMRLTWDCVAPSRAATHVSPT